MVTVMAGVALVGLSGSMIKDTLKESPLGNVLGLRPSENTAPEPIDVPEATTVLVGELPSRSIYLFPIHILPLGVFFILFAQIL